MEIRTAEYRPFHGSSYIPLPSELKNKHAIVNVQNQDEKCFVWAVLASLYPVQKNSNRVSKYEQHLAELDIDGFEFPIKKHQIKSFEKKNNISINVFGWDSSEKDKPCELFLVQPSCIESDREVDLLLISEGEKQHYCTIRNFSRLCSSLSKHDGQSFWCRFCFHRFSSQRTLDSHTSICRKVGKGQKITMPEPGNNTLEFKRFESKLRLPFVVYADFECILVEGEMEEMDRGTSYTVKRNKHLPCGVAWVLVGMDGQAMERENYRGQDVVSKFFEKMFELEQWVLDSFASPAPMDDLTWKEQLEFDHATRCHICEKSLSSKDIRVRDHCHVTGKYRGAAHQKCNLDFKIKRRIPIVFHNLKGYDSHLLMQEAGKYKKEIDVIAQNMEKYITFKIGLLTFIDSLAFLNTSLDNLVKNLAMSSEEKFRNTKDMAWRGKQLREDQFRLLLRKGVYPYEYMNSFERFQEQQLPPKESFYSALSGAGIEDEDYHHAERVWAAFEMNTLWDYHDLYVQSDVSLLADVVENLRTTAISEYHLDPLHSLTLPGFSWEAMLKQTGVKLELLTEPDMHLFI